MVKIIEAYLVGNHRYICDEEWRDAIIDGCYTGYQVSNLGRVRDDFGNIVKLSKSRKYQLFSYPGGITKLSRVIALTFIPIPQKYLDMGLTSNDLVVDHIRDGDEDNHEDNSIWNLQWLTGEENYKKAYNKGLMKGRINRDLPQISGMKNYLASHTDEDAIRVRDLLYENKLTIPEIVKETNTDIHFVKDILYKHAWRHVIGDCDFSGYNKCTRQSFRNPPQPFSKEVNDFIKLSIENGYTVPEILDKLTKNNMIDRELYKIRFHINNLMRLYRLHNK